MAELIPPFEVKSDLGYTVVWYRPVRQTHYVKTCYRCGRKVLRPDKALHVVFRINNLDGLTSSRVVRPIGPECLRVDPDIVTRTFREFATELSDADRALIERETK